MVHTARRHRAVRTALLTAAAAGLVAAGLVAPLQAAAEPEPVEPDPCEGAVTLSEADRLAGNCLPGNDVARLLQEGAVPELDVDEEASSENVTRLANIPKQGAFAPEDALGSDLAFQGN